MRPIHARRRWSAIGLVVGAVALVVPPWSPAARAQEAHARDGDPSAQAPHVVWIAGRPGPEAAGRARRWQRRIARALESRGGVVTIEPESWAHEPAEIERARVERFARVEDLLRESRELRARLEPARALSLLVDAERIVLGSLDVPGASAWYAEVEIAIAIAADENGDRALADQALARAASADPRRALGAAEAPPDLLARAQAIARTTATAPRGRFEIRASVPAAVWLGATRLGEARPDAPLRVEVSAGVHVVRVEASGHRTWARLLDVLEGGRPALDIALSPQPALDAARALRVASDLTAVGEPGAGEPTGLERVVRSLATLESMGRAPRALWLVEVSEGAIDRAIVIGCRVGGCEAPIRLDAERVESALPADPGAADDAEPLTPGAIAHARDWLDEPIPEEPPPPPSPEWWQTPWPWAIAGVLAAGAIAGAIGATYQPSPPREQLDVTVPPAFPWVP